MGCFGIDKESVSQSLLYDGVFGFDEFRGKALFDFFPSGVSIE